MTTTTSEPSPLAAPKKVRRAKKMRNKNLSLVKREADLVRKYHHVQDDFLHNRAPLPETNRSTSVKRSQGYGKLELWIVKHPDDHKLQLPRVLNPLEGRVKPSSSMTVKYGKGHRDDRPPQYNK
jgi:hypothetical protein